MMTTTDVLVVGAGPTGSDPGRVTDCTRGAGDGGGRVAEGANTSRAAAVNARERWRFSTTSTSAAAGQGGHRGTALHHPRRRRVLIPLDFSGLPTAYPFTLMVPQADTERLLLERVRNSAARSSGPRR